MNKKRVKRLLRSIVPPAIARAREQIAFDRLGRKPPELMWKVCQASREPRTEAQGITIGGRLYLVGGYQSINEVLSVVDVFDFDRERWVDRVGMPADVPQTHAGICCAEDRFIYSVAGQLGPRCGPATTGCFVLDSRNKSWDRLPSLPEARYGPVALVCNGRLHVFSGAKPDRWTSACDHWSVAVAGGKALDRNWRTEPPIPRGGPHQAKAIIGGKPYVFGGQDGDIMPIAGDPDFVCNQNTPLEALYGDSFMWEVGTGEWRTIPTMPSARTHSESEVVVSGRYALVAGGNEGRYMLSDLVQVYDAQANHWRIAGRLPYYMKTAAAYHGGCLYVFMGQRSVSRTNLRPDVVSNTVWRAEFDPAHGAT